MNLYDLVRHLNDGRDFRIAQLVEKGVHGSFVYGAVVLVTYLDEGRAVAGVKAFHLFEGEHSVGRSLAVSYAKLGL